MNTHHKPVPVTLPLIGKIAWGAWIAISAVFGGSVAVAGSAYFIGQKDTSIEARFEAQKVRSEQLEQVVRQLTEVLAAQEKEIRTDHDLTLVINANVANIKESVDRISRALGLVASSRKPNPER